MPEIPAPLYVLWLALCLDVLCGEPPNAIHPVALMGKIISLFRRYAPTDGRWKPLLVGILFVLSGASICGAAAWAVHEMIQQIPTLFSLLIEAAAFKLTFSVRALISAGIAVRSALTNGDLAGARCLVAWHLVSRDTSTLNESQVAAATIESLAENLSDGFIAPLFCYLLGGLPAVWAYRFLNTCDAMLGYRDPEREWLGKSAARLDDMANLIPARITAGLLLVTGFLTGRGVVRPIGIWWRDRLATASPNAGQPMSAAAGVLGIELEKIGQYRLGAGQRLPSDADIRRAIWLVSATVGLAAILASATVIFLVR